jgi:hypothetical protein
MSKRRSKFTPPSIKGGVDKMAWALALAMAVGMPVAHADQASCERRSERGMEEGAHISGRTNLFRVIAKPGLPLHTAPNAACLPPQPLALKPGTDVIAYVVHHDYTAVLWNPPGAAKPEVLWVLSTGLRPLGYGIAPR